MVNALSRSRFECKEMRDALAKTAKRSRQGRRNPNHWSQLYHPPTQFPPCVDRPRHAVTIPPVMMSATPNQIPAGGISD